MPSDGRFSGVSKQQGERYRERYFRGAIFEALKNIEPVVQKNNLTMVETAFRWLVHHSKLNLKQSEGGNDGIIVGVSSLKQLEGNINDLEKGPLPEEVTAVLDEAWTNIGGTAPNYWR